MALSKLCNQKPEKKIERKKMSLIQLSHKRFSEIWKPALMVLLEKWPCPTFPIMRRTKRNGRIRKYCCFGGETNINQCMCNLNELWHIFKTQFHLKRFFSAYISELKKGLFHVEIFRHTGLFKNCDIRYKTINYINSEHFYFSKLSPYFSRWLEKFNELRSNWRPAPPPTAPPLHLSSIVSTKVPILGSQKGDLFAVFVFWTSE